MGQSSSLLSGERSRRKRSQKGVLRTFSAQGASRRFGVLPTVLVLSRGLGRRSARVPAPSKQRPEAEVRPLFGRSKQPLQVQRLRRLDFNSRC